MFHARRHRITIERRTEDGFERICETWAEIRGNVISIRYQPEIYPDYRVVIGSDHFRIVGVVDRRGKTRLTELQVEESGARDNAVRALGMNSIAKGFSQSVANASNKDKNDASVRR
jgi:hypothetical protein